MTLLRQLPHYKCAKDPFPRRRAGSLGDRARLGKILVAYEKDPVTDRRIAGRFVTFDSRVRAVRLRVAGVATDIGAKIHGFDPLLSVIDEETHVLRSLISRCLMRLVVTFAIYVAKVMNYVVNFIS